MHNKLKIQTEFITAGIISMCAFAVIWTETLTHFQNYDFHNNCSQPVLPCRAHCCCWQLDSSNSDALNPQMNKGMSSEREREGELIPTFTRLTLLGICLWSLGMWNLFSLDASVAIHCDTLTPITVLTFPTAGTSVIYWRWSMTSMFSSIDNCIYEFSAVLVRAEERQKEWGNQSKQSGRSDSLIRRLCLVYSLSLTFTIVKYSTIQFQIKWENQIHAGNF